jgi:hypothetical protein
LKNYGGRAEKFGGENLPVFFQLEILFQGKMVRIDKEVVFEGKGLGEKGTGSEDG